MADEVEAVPRRNHGTDLLGVVFVLAAAALAGYGLRDHWPAVGQALAEIGWWRILVATGLVIAGLLATAEVWRHCLSALTAPVSHTVAREIFFPSQVGKYLPGSVWPFLAQMRLARRHGIAASAALLAGSVFLVMHAVTSVPVASMVLFAQPSFAGKLAIAGVCAAAGFVLLHPKILGIAVRKLAARSGGEVRPLRWAQVIRPLAWMVPAWACYGAAGFVVAAPVGGDPLVLAALCTGAFAISWLVGVVAIIAPAGLGAREAVLVLAFLPVLGIANATSVALVLRVCHTAGDIILAAWFGLRAKRTDRIPAVSPTSTPQE